MFVNDILYFVALFGILHKLVKFPADKVVLIQALFFDVEISVSLPFREDGDWLFEHPNVCRFMQAVAVLGNIFLTELNDGLVQLHGLWPFSWLHHKGLPTALGKDWSNIHFVKVKVLDDIAVDEKGFLVGQSFLKRVLPVTEQLCLLFFNVGIHHFQVVLGALLKFFNVVLCSPHEVRG